MTIQNRETYQATSRIGGDGDIFKGLHRCCALGSLLLSCLCVSAHKGGAYRGDKGVGQREEKSEERQSSVQSREGKEREGGHLG